MIFNMSGGYGSGGGASTNLKLVYGETRPTNPSNNTVWVDTSIPVTKYYFQAEQPENMREGELWITIGDSGRIRVTTSLGKEWVTVYFIGAQQYVNGALVGKTVKTYQNGEWLDWWNGELLDGANLFETVTGGWVQDTNLNISGYANTGTVTFDTNGITLSNAPGATSAIVRTKNKINLSGYSKLTANAQSIAASGNISVRIYIITGASGDIDNIKVASIENIASTDFVDYELPFNLDGEYYIALVISAGRSGIVKKISLS